MGDLDFDWFINIQMRLTQDTDLVLVELTNAKHPKANLGFFMEKKSQVKIFNVYQW